MKNVKKKNDISATQIQYENDHKNSFHNNFSDNQPTTFNNQKTESNLIKMEENQKAKQINSLITLQIAFKKVTALKKLAKLKEEKVKLFLYFCCIFLIKIFC